jgi:hypothetical protein
VRLGCEPLGHGLALGRGGGGQQPFDMIGRGNPRRSVHHQRGADARFVQQHVGLEQFELEPHRPQFLAQEEIGIAERQPIGRVLLLRGGSGVGSTKPASCSAL